jgi:hypothetical protein
MLIRSSAIDHVLKCLGETTAEQGYQCA